MSTTTTAGLELRKKKTDWAGIASVFGIGLIVIYCLAPFYWMIVSSLRPDKEIFENSNMPMSTGSAMQQELMQGMNQMHQDMMAAAQYKDPDVAFAAGMLPHHIGAVKMAEVELKYGKDPEMRKLAENIINAQQAEIEQMQKWLKAHNKKASRSLHPR